MHGGQEAGGPGGVLALKLGGSVVTVKEEPFSVRLGLLEELAGVLAEASRERGLRYAIVLGGGSYGHVAAYELRRGGAEPGEALSTVTMVMAELGHVVADVLSSQGLRAVVFPPHAFCSPRGLRPNCVWGPVLAALEAGATPLLYGDAYPCPGDGWCIVSGDELVVELACAVGSETVIYLSDVDGVYGPGGSLLRRVTLSRLAELASVGGRRGGYDVTGGLARKIEAMRANWCSGLRGVWVVNGLRPERVRSLLLGGDAVATLVEPG